MLKNILANYLGKIWTLISGFIFIPLYIRYLGFESYSIISFMLIISSVMMVLDAGLTATLSREFAKNDIKLQDKVDLYKTLETIYILIFFIVLISIVIFSDLLSNNFFKVTSYSAGEISRFLKIISIDISGQMVFKFYIGGLIGLEKHVLSNILQVSWSFIRNALVVLLLIFYSNLEIFFYWQAFTTIIFTFIAKIKLEHSFLNESNLKYKFFINSEALKRIKYFAFGMLFISLVAAINTQLDKIFISKLLPIKVLGTYTLGVSISMGIITLVNPVSVAMLPRFTRLYSTANVAEAKELFDLVNGVVNIVVFSVMAVLIFCAKGILLTWTGSEKIAMEGYQFLMILTIGNAMVAMQIIPYCVAIANGSTIINNILGLSSIILSVPSYWFATKYFGALGVAFAYSAIQILLTLFYLIYINRCYFNFSLRNLLLKRVFLPFLSVFLFGYAISKFELENDMNRFFSILYYCVIVLSIITVNIFLFYARKIKDLIKDIKIKS
jgi:O-antigen/teichoic acid export membrane protein